MNIPGLTGTMADPNLREKAEQESERLLEELKKSIKTEVKDVGVLRKELRITVPAKVVADHLDHNYNDLMRDAMVPGFRKGHAPRQLVEKRFGADVRESIKTTIVGQSFFAAAENEKFEVLGDPRFRLTDGDEVKLVEIDEALRLITIPDEGDFSYECEVEVKPTFELPPLEGIEIKSPKITITDAQVDERILRQRKIRGHYEPQLEGAAGEDDQVIADATLTVDGQEIKTEENVQLGVRATRLDTIPLMTLGDVLKGVKAGDTPGVDCEIPDDYERADLRGKAARFEFKIHEIKRLAPLSEADYAEQMGCDSIDQVRQFVREDLEEELDDLVQRAKKEQVYEYLLEKTTLDLPEDLSARQTDRAVVRHVIELQQAGVPQGDIESRIDELRTSAKKDVARDLKLGFILEKVAEKLEVDASDEEVNTEIARMARMYNRRFDRVRDDLQGQGLLSQLAETIRHDKCITKLLEDATLVEVAEEKPKPKEKPAAETPKRTAKSAEKKAPAQDAKKVKKTTDTKKKTAAKKLSKKAKGGKSS